jgi:hypothetical protein
MAEVTHILVPICVYIALTYQQFDSLKVYTKVSSGPDGKSQLTFIKTPTYPNPRLDRMFDYALNIVGDARLRQAALYSILNVHNNGSMEGLSLESVPKNRKYLFQSLSLSVEFIIQNNAAGLGINRNLNMSLCLIN